MSPKWNRYALLLFAFVLVCVGCTPAGPAPTPTLRSDYKLGIVLNEGGSIRDGTFNEFAYNGASLAARDFGLDFAYIETVEGKDYTPAIEKMIAEGRNIIVTVGFQMAGATLEAAAKHPTVYFMGVDQAYENAPANAAGINFQEDEGGFLAGALAGMMTKSNVVGVVGGMEIPPVQRYVNGFINGAKYVNPNVEVKSVFTSAFDNPREGSDEAEKMIAEKADVIFGAGGLTGSGGIAYAAQNKVYVIGVDQDEFRTTFASGKDADYILTSAVKRVDTGVYTVVKSILDNNFKPGNVVLSAAECGITYAPFHNADKTIPADVKSRLEAIWRALAGKTLNTGAATADSTPPEALAAGALPTISDKAPKLSDCTRG